MYYFVTAASASSNVILDTCQSEATFHNDIGFATVCQWKGDRQWKAAVNYSATNHCTDERDVILIYLVTPVFISITLDGVTSFFSHQ